MKWVFFLFRFRERSERELREEREERNKDRREKEKEERIKVMDKIVFWGPNWWVLECFELNWYYHKPQGRFVKFTLYIKKPFIKWENQIGHGIKLDSNLIFYVKCVIK